MKIVKVENLDAVLTVTELADELKVSPRSIRNWMKDGTGLKYVRLGSTVRFRRTDVESWLQTKYEGV